MKSQFNEKHSKRSNPSHTPKESCRKRELSTLNNQIVTPVFKKTRTDNFSIKTPNDKEAEFVFVTGDDHAVYKNNKFTNKYAINGKTVYMWRCATRGCKGSVHAGCDKQGYQLLADFKPHSFVHEPNWTLANAVVKSEKLYLKHLHGTNTHQTWSDTWNDYQRFNNLNATTVFANHQTYYNEAQRYKRLVIGEKIDAPKDMRELVRICETTNILDCYDIKVRNQIKQHDKQKNDELCKNDIIMKRHPEQVLNPLKVELIDCDIAINDLQKKKKYLQLKMYMESAVKGEDDNLFLGKTRYNDLVIASKKGIKALQSKIVSKYYVDCTFTIGLNYRGGKICYQVLLLAAGVQAPNENYYSRTFTCVYAFMCRKKKEHYSAVYNIMFKDLDLSGNAISSDLEKAIYGALPAKIKRQLSVELCYFHFTQTIMNNNHKKGLTVLYFKNGEYAYLLRLILCSPYLPLQEVELFFLKVLDEMQGLFAICVF